MVPATIFFLPVATRPKDFPPLPKNFKGKYWHVGIIFGDKVYETYSDSKYRISSPKEEQITFLRTMKAIFRTAKVDPKKITSEITSGTSCDQYVLRCLRYSRLKGNSKGLLYPEDVYNIVRSGPPPITFPKSEWMDIQKRLNSTETIYTTRVSREIFKFAIGRYFNAPWNDLLYVTELKKYTDVKDHPFHNDLTDEQIEQLEREIDDYFIVVKMVRT